MLFGKLISTYLIMNYEAIIDQTTKSILLRAEEHIIIDRTFQINI